MRSIGRKKKSMPISKSTRQPVSQSSQNSVYGSRMKMDAILFQSVDEIIYIKAIQFDK
jgi:hypothetical protein